LKNFRATSRKRAASFRIPAGGSGATENQAAANRHAAFAFLMAVDVKLD
jgi:hypothetical protein